MTGRVHKPAAPAAKPTPPAPAAAEPVLDEAPPATVPVALKRRDDAPDLSGSFRQALERIAKGRLCGCRGDHDDEVNDCPRTIARRTLEAE